VHKYVKRDQRFIPLQRNAAYKKCLEKLTVPARCFGPLRKQLNVCGVNEVQFFPGLGGLARHLNLTCSKIGP
jgi:hypothetical protein